MSLELIVEKMMNDERCNELDSTEFIEVSNCDELKVES